MVCVLKICKQCLQTASASTPYRGFAPGPHCETPWATAPKGKFLAPPVKLHLTATKLHHKNWTVTKNANVYKNKRNEYKGWFRQLFMPSNQEMDWTYSTVPGPHTRHTMPIKAHI